MTRGCPSPDGRTPGQFEAAPPGWSAVYGQRVEAWQAPAHAFIRALQNFDVITQAVIVPSVNWQPVTTFIMPTGSEGTLQSFGTDVDNLNGWQQVQWRVTVNDGVIGQPGVYPALGPPAGMLPNTLRPLYAALAAGNRVQLEAFLTPAGEGTTVTVRGCLKGHSWPLGRRQD